MSMLLQRCDTALANIGVTDGLWTERDRGYLRSCADCDSTNLPTMIVLSVGLGVTVACSSPTVAPVPRVAGLRLDDAHNALKGAGFKEFNDVDAVGKRSALVDSNWAVVSQIPASGESVDVKMRIELNVAKPEDKGIRDLLPKDSPVLAQILEKDRQRDLQTAFDAADQQRKADQASAASKTAAVNYVNTIDPGVRIGQSQLRKVATLRDQVANGAVAGNALTLNVDLGTTAIGQYEQLLSIPTVPRGLAGALGSLNSALMGFQRALQTLLSADGPSAAEALSRVDTILSQS